MTTKELVEVYGFEAKNESTFTRELTDSSDYEYPLNRIVIVVSQGNGLIELFEAVIGTESIRIASAFGELSLNQCCAIVDTFLEGIGEDKIFQTEK